MQQSSATQSLHLWFLGVAEDCCMLSLLLAVPSCRPTVFGTVSSLHPTSFLMIFILVILYKKFIIAMMAGCWVYLDDPYNDTLVLYKNIYS